MSFMQQAGAAAVLLMVTLWFECAGMGTLIYWARRRAARGMYQLGIWDSAVLMVRFTSVMIGMHVGQVLLWAMFYRWRCLPSWESAFYFSAGSYSTIGCPDIVLPRVWRVLGPLESVAGMLMCGLSVSFLFAIVTRLVGREMAGRANPSPSLESVRPE